MHTVIQTLLPIFITYIIDKFLQILSVRLKEKNERKQARKREKRKERKKERAMNNH